MDEKSPKIIALEDAPANLDLSRWTGRLPQPAASFGEARAAQVADLRLIRDRKLYAGLTRTWDEFCEKHLLVSRRSVDRNIRQLREFGPVFFRVAEAMRLSAQQYRRIRGHVCAEGVLFDNGVIPFVPQNQRPLSDAIAELLLRNGGRLGRKPTESYGRMMRRVTVAANSLDRFDRRLDGLQKLEVAASMGRILRRGLQLGVRPA
jgi:hypothetical protein